jgi:polysaccharide biosynthesis/export protein
VVDFPGLTASVRGFSVDLVSYGTGGAWRFFEIVAGEMTNKQNLAAVLLLLAGCGVSAVEAQVASVGQNQESSEGGPAWSGNLGFEPVGSGDLVYISVTGSPDLSRSSRVTEDGKLTLPLLREGVPVAGLTPSKIAQAVSAALVREKVLIEPVVSVSVLEYRSRHVSVVGAVRMPSNFQAIGNMRLLDAIARALRQRPVRK